MLSYKIEFFGHCHKDNHDKIWGYVCVQDEEMYSFWGKRGAKMAFKRHGNVITARDELDKKERQKRRKGGYLWIPNSDIEALFPGFIDSFENDLFLAKMSDHFRVDDLAN